MSVVKMSKNSLPEVALRPASDMGLHPASDMGLHPASDMGLHPASDMEFLLPSTPQSLVTLQPMSNGTDPSQDAFENLMPALIQCFGIIFAGYFAGRINLLTQSQGKGIGAFVGSFAMPAMLFKSMVELQFGAVDWFFLLAIFIAKFTVFLATILMTLLLVHPINTGKMGIYGIFTTQSHDFALGIPIVQALYSISHPDYEKYLYLIAPISVAFLNPIGFILLEVERWRHRSQDRGQRRGLLLCKVLGRVLTNPIVFMTLFGIAGNFILKQKIPGLLDNLLTALKQAFPATALFCLGLSMVGRLSSRGGPSNFITTALLIAAKMLVSPFLVRELVTVLPGGRNVSQTEMDSMSTYAFLYGAFPTAPSVFIYASQYDTQAELMATGMVVSTFLAAPLMFISARMITLSSATRDIFVHLLSTTSVDVSIISLVACVWVLTVFTIHRRLGTLPHKFTTGLLISQVFVGIGTILGNELDMTVPWQHYLHFVIFYVGILSSRFWMVGIAMLLCMLRGRSLCFVLRIHGWIALACVLIPVLLCSMLLLLVHREVGAQSLAFEYGRAQLVINIVCLLLTCIVSIVCLVLQQRWRPTCPLPADRNVCPQGQPCAETDPLLSENHESSNSYIDRTHINGIPPQRNPPRRVTASGRRRAGLPTTRSTPRSTPQEQSTDPTCETCTDCGDCSTSVPTAPRVTNIEDLVPDVEVRTGRRRLTSQSSDGGTVPSCSLERACSVEQRTRCAELLRGYNSFKLQFEEEEDEEQLALLEGRDEFQMTRHIILVLLLLMSALVGLFLNMWRLMKESQTGVYIEIEFLDSVFAYGQGIFTFAVFGLDSEMVLEPLFNRLKHWLAKHCPSLASRWGRPKVHVLSLDDLSATILQTCAKFLNYHQTRCATDIVRDRRRGQHQYQSSFTGRNLIDWLIEVGLCTDRAEALQYGRHLLAGGVIEHVHQEHNFYDLPYLYHFTDSPKSNSSNSAPLSGRAQQV